MADTTDTNEPTPGDLRTQRDQLQREKDELARKVAQFEQQEQLRQSGLGHLSARQQRSILRELAEDGKDFTREDALAIAEDLGYKVTPDETPPTPPTPPADGGNGTGNGTGNQDPDDADDALTVMALMDRARAAAAGNAGNSDFDQEMRATKSPAELTELIRREGARHSMVHEWDVP